MKIPALLLGSALIFWGWQTGLWVLAAVMALVFEASRLIRLRWDLAPKDFGRVSDGCTTLFIILLIYLLMSERSATFIVVVIQWLPVVLFPLLVVQAYSTSEQIDIRKFFVLRRRFRKQTDRRLTAINLTYPYFAICLVSAAAANVRDSWFYFGVFVLTAFALRTVRSRRYSVLIWISMMTIGGCAGFVGHFGLHGLQLVLEKKGLEWTSDFTTHEPDPFQTHTAIGDIGTLKPSGRILFRVTPDAQPASPMLLRESTYNRYLSPIWVAMDPDFKPLKPETDKTTWQLADQTTGGRTITVAAPLYKGRGLLKLPDGAFQIERLPVVTVERSKYGTVKVEGGPGVVDYRIHFAGRGVNVSAPTKLDLGIPQKEWPVLNQIRDQLQLDGLPPREILKRVESFFLNEFQYSLVQRDVGRKKSPLSHFLLNSRAGHCEYFATGTVLLLRAAGIPARYSRGYSVHEFSDLENRFIVRDRHAHAWALVYVDGTWHNFDTTPGTWVSLENTAAPHWQILTDLWSWCKFNLSRAWWWLRQSRIFGYLWWLGIPIILIPARRLFRKRRLKRVARDNRPTTQKSRMPAGTDSEFYLIEEALAKGGVERPSAETLRNWIGRLPQKQGADRLMAELDSILNLHYRCRFDPNGISLSEKAALKSGVQAWLSSYQRLEQGC
jgi:hypothetical protein